MRDEHFGISVVEFMAAGLIPLVHASAGPLLDIVVPRVTITKDGKSQQKQRTGWHATDAESFAEGMHEILSLDSKEQKKVREAARALAVEKFSLEEFERGWSGFWGRLVGLLPDRSLEERGRDPIKSK